MEIGACFLFLTALIVIIATLSPRQGKPLPQWPYQVSVNSLVSIYVVILKVTVIFVTAEGLGMYISNLYTYHNPISQTHP